MIGVSLFGEFGVAVVLTLVLGSWLYLQKHRGGLVLLSIALLFFLSADFFKILFERPRPEIYLIEGYTLPESFSYPSGHVVFYSIYFGIILLLSLAAKNAPLWLRLLLISISVSLIVLIGYSRVYLGVHWPTDVMGGYLLGLALLLLFLVFYQVVPKKN
jgi:undecaprenyl-diphosphatase